MEMNLGFRNTLITVNAHRVEESTPPVGRNAMMNAFDRMQPKVELIQKVQQGNTNHKAWKNTQRNQTKQFLVMLDELPESESLKEHPKGISSAFNKDRLPKVSRNQLVFYDETHIDQEGYTTTHTGYQIRFPRDASGKYAPLSPSNPSLVCTNKVTKTSFKYAGQSRLCLGLLP